MGDSRSSTVGDLFTRGRAANFGGRPAEGERLLRRALRVLALADDEATDLPSVGRGTARPAEARVRIMLSLSTSLVQRRGAEPALETAREAMTVAQDAALAADVRSGLLAKCRLQQAMILGRAGHLDDALEQLDLALRTVDQLGPQDRFELLLSRGAVRSDGPDPALAEADFAEAAELARRHGLARQEFMARHNLAQVALVRGDLPRALRLHRELERLGADASAAVARHGRAVVLLEAGLLEEAVDLLEDAAGEALRNGQRLLAGDIQTELAGAYFILGRPEQASDVAARARRSLRRGEAPGLHRRAELVLLEARLQRGRRLTEVAARARQLATAFSADGDQVASDLAHLLAAEVDVGRGEPGAALRQLRRLPHLTRVGSLSTRMRARRVLAEAARAAADPVAARRHVRAALLDLVETVGASASLEVRAATHVYAQRLAGLDLDLATGGPRDTLLALERWREVASRTPAVRPPDDPELARRITVLRHLEQQIGADPGRADALRSRRRELERSVAALSWAAPGRHGVRDAVTGRDLRQALQVLAERDTALVYLAERRDHLAAVVSRRGRCAVVDLGPIGAVAEASQRLVIDLQTCCRAYGAPMEDRVRGSLARSLQRLDALLLAPLRPHGATLAGRLLVVPTPALAAIPWGLLPGRAGRPTPVAPCLSAWADPETAVVSPVVRALSGPGLVDADQECRAVARAWSAGSAQAQASGADLAAALTTSDLVHVAAHGRHRDDSPLFSSLELTDGPHFLAVLERSSIRATQVVLSACDSGRARQRGGQSTLGLTAGLLALGVPSVVAAPCRIPDAVAADHMPRYHGLLAQGCPADEALASAAADRHPLAGAFTVWGAPWRAGRTGTAP